MQFRRHRTLAAGNRPAPDPAQSGRLAYVPAELVPAVFPAPHAWVLSVRTLSVCTLLVCTPFRLTPLAPTPAVPAQSVLAQ